MLGRQVTAALRRPLQARFRTTAASQTSFNLAIRTFSHAPRLLDPAGRPRKAVGEPSRPVKRAVKKAAKKPATPEDEAAAALVAEKKRLAKEKRETKLATAKEKQKNKTAAAKERQKKKTAADAQKAKKAKEAARAPEKLAKKKAALLKAENRDLVKAALSPPFPSMKHGAWLSFLRERSQELKASFDALPEKSRGQVKEVLSENIRKFAADWKEKSAADIEHYNHIAHTTQEVQVAEYKRWVESHSVEEIKLANSARRTLLRRKFVKPKHQLTRVIEDERLPKHSLSPYVLFCVSRHQSGDFKNISVPERSKLLGQEWKALSEDEKAKYISLSEQDQKRYASEKSDTEQSDA